MCAELCSPNDFVKCASHKDGLNSYCKKCRKRYRENRYPIEKSKGLFTYSFRKKNLKKYRDNNKQKIRARAAVKTAITNKKLIKLPCSSCQSPLNVNAHHQDYNKPLDVTWLCRICHVNIHFNDRD